MNYNLNALIKMPTEPQEKDNSMQSFANEFLYRSTVTSCYESTMKNIKQDLKNFEIELETVGQAPSFSLSKKKIVFNNLLKEENPTYIGYCYLTGYGTKKDVSEATKYLIKTESGKLIMAKAYIIGKGVSKDFNKAFEVYPDTKNPVCNFMVYMNGKYITVRELLFDQN